MRLLTVITDCVVKKSVIPLQKERGAVNSPIFVRKTLKRFNQSLRFMKPAIHPRLLEGLLYLLADINAGLPNTILKPLKFRVAFLIKKPTGSRRFQVG